MKKYILLLGIIIFSLGFKMNIFAYTFANDFNYTKAVNKMFVNSTNYSDGLYWASRYKYSGNDTNYQGKFTQNFNYDGNVYSFGILKQGSTGYECYVLAPYQFQSRRWNVDGSPGANSTQSINGSTVNGTLVTDGNNMNADLYTMIHNSGVTVYFGKFDLGSEYWTNDNYIANFPIFASWDDFFRTLYENDYNVPIFPPGEETQTGDLPFLHYQLQRNTTLSLSNVIPSGVTKLTFKWDYTEIEPYLSNPQNYSFDIMAWANFKTVNGSEVFDSDTLTYNDSNKCYLTQGGQNISLNEFSFIYEDVGKRVYSNAGKTWLEDNINSISNGYILAIRTANNQRTNFSWWKLFIVQAGGYVTSTGKVMKPDGSIINSTAENSNDGMDTSNNGTSNYTGQTGTTAQNDTTGTVYEGTSKLNIAELFATLQSLVNQIGNIPSILANLMTFLPGWLTSLLAISIGLFVTIGLVKLIAR